MNPMHGSSDVPAGTAGEEPSEYAEGRLPTTQQSMDYVREALARALRLFDPLVGGLLE